MNIFFQSQNVELDAEMRDFMANRMYGLEKFFSPGAQAFIDVEKTRASHHGHDLYYVSMRIQDGAHRYFTEEYQENIRKTFDHAYGEIFRIVRDDRSKSRNLARKAETRIKNLFKRRGR